MASEPKDLRVQFERYADGEVCARFSTDDGGTLAATCMTGEELQAIGCAPAKKGREIEENEKGGAVHE